MLKPAQTCEKNDAIFMQKISLKLSIAFKTVYSCCFSLERILDFLQKCFATLTTDRNNFFGWKPWSSANGRRLKILKIVGLNPRTVHWMDILKINWL